MNTLFRNERIERILMDLEKLQFRFSFPLSSIFYMERRFDSPEMAAPFIKEARPYPIYGQWGGRNSYFWFTATVHLPDGLEKEQLLLRVSTACSQKEDTALLSTFVNAPTHHWDLMNPQFMVFVNGLLRQGMDTNHTTVYLEPEDYQSGTLRLDFQAYTGLTDARYSFLPEICVLDTPVKDLYYDILTLFEAALTLSEQSPQRFSLLQTINHAVNLLDLRNPGSSVFYESISNAAAYLAEHGYGPADPSVTVTCVGHTHIDMAWLWDLEQTRLKGQRSFSTVLSMMKRYPGYIFMHSSPQLYSFIKQDNPALYERIREKISEGSWEPEGAMWLEADCNIPCGESLVRQIVYGKQFIRREFHRDSRVLWLPDVFGYSAALPQILKKSGIDCFVTSKISWNMLNTMPCDTFLWKGIDGSEILTYFITTPEPGGAEGTCGATYNGVLQPETVYGTWKKYKQKEVNTHVLMCYGYGDGGGGPTDAMLEKLVRMKKGIPGFPTVNTGGIQPFFKELLRTMEGSKYLPKWTGELYLELHQGTYTSNGEIKRNNRRAEGLLFLAESLRSFLFCLGDIYPADEIHKMWEILLLNQFHDTLPGSCIHKVYEDSRVQFGTLFRQLDTMISNAMKCLARRVSSQSDGLLVYQPGSFSRNAVLETSFLPYKKQTRYLTCTGELLPCQFTEEGRLLLCLTGLPATGYTVLNAVKTDESPDLPVYPVTETHMENAFFSFDINGAGELINLYDKKARRMIFAGQEAGNRLMIYEDRPRRWDAWNIDMYYEEKSWHADRITDITVTERGPVRYALRICRKYNRSSITQTIYLYHHIARIDFVTDVDWHEDSSVLKAEFPLDINTDHASFDIQYGSIRRPTHQNTSWDAAKYEVCAHKWADLSEGDYGISLLNNCKYGYSVHDSRISLTLLKAGMSPDPLLDRGKHHFTYALYAHSGTPQDGGTINEALSLNLPLPAEEIHRQKGCLSTQASFFTCSHTSVVLDCIKKAENEDALILRFYEAGNKRYIARFTCLFPMASVYDCNLLEEVQSEVSLTDSCSFEYEVKPFSVNTCKIYLTGGIT